MPDRDPASFLSRWSRLKRGETDKPTPHEQPEASPAERPSEQPVAEVRAEDLPSIDDLEIDSDISAFLQKGVPEHLQRLALRKMWTLDPAIRDFIEVAENQYDFNAGAVPGFGELAPGVDMQRLLAQAIGAEPAKPSQSETDAVRQAAADHPAASMHQPSPQTPATADVAMQQATELPESCAEEPAPPRRRRHGGALPT